MTIVTELKKIFKKLSGQDSIGHTTDEVLSEIADVVGQGEGSGSGTMLLHCNPVDTGYALDKTFKEIQDAVEAGIIVVFNDFDGNESVHYCSAVLTETLKVKFGIPGASGSIDFTADSVNGYPAIDGGEPAM